MITYFKHFWAIFISLLMIASCNMAETLPNDETPVDGKHQCKMVFQCDVAGYDGTTVRSVGTKGSSSWSEGDRVYITFYNGTSIVPGIAVFSESDGWSVSYDGDLAKGSRQRCEVRFFVNPTFANDNQVSLNQHTEIYEDNSGSFDYSDGALTVTASLTPKVGRIRFTGSANAKIYLTGISVFTTYTPASNAFSSSSAMIAETVASNGSTPYIYGSIDNSDRKIGLVGSSFAFTRTCSSEVLKEGDSGYMAIPSEASHHNWRSGLFVKVNNVEFKMVAVPGLSSGFFLIGETEVTNALYKVVTNISNWASDNKPAVRIYGSNNNEWEYIKWTEFITLLNYATNLTFGIPNAEQWKYAAKGGNVSQGYSFAGSNTPGDVAWYAGNAGGTLHEVKQLAPNELGIYDMSGNAAEWVSTDSSGFQNSIYHDYYGGCFKADESLIGIASLCGNTYQGYNSTDWRYTSNATFYNCMSLRVILTCK